jgi:hypothetical protein
MDGLGDESVDGRGFDDFATSSAPGAAGRSRDGGRCSAVRRGIESTCRLRDAFPYVSGLPRPGMDEPVRDAMASDRIRGPATKGQV